MNVCSFYTLSKKEQQLFFDFCKVSYYSSVLPAAANMWHEKWEEHPNTLPFLLLKTNRFKNKGEFFVITDNNKFVACGGVYVSDFSDDIAIAGTRCWVDTCYRNKLIVREILLPQHKIWCIKNNIKQIALSFNNYNKSLIATFKRQSIAGYKSKRKPHHLFFKNFNELSFLVTVRNTKQWVIYEKLDDTWEFNWRSIIAV